MMLIDTSVWVEYLRKTDSRANRALREIVQEEPLKAATTEPISMELLAGATSDKALLHIETLTTGLPCFAVDQNLDYRDAASMYRNVRRNGKTVRKLIDCLIAAVAIRNNVVLLHRDEDFETIAQYYPLETHPLFDQAN